VIPSGDKKVGKDYKKVCAKTEGSVIPSGDKKVQDELLAELGIN
jgi:hypothetical protein